jgi:two-component system, NtrC family, sensor histidine kinase HydH
MARKANHRQTFNLRLWFGIAASGVIVALAAAFAFVMSAFMTDILLQREIQVTREFLDSVVSAEGPVDRMFDPTDIANAALANVAYHIRWMPDVVRANIYGPDRSIVWSTDPKLIGQKFEDNDELEDAFAGRMVTEVGRIGADEKEEHTALKAGATGVFIESYMPFRDKDRVRGVVELYKLPTAMEAAIKHGRQDIWISAAAGAAILFATLFWIVRRGARIIERQQVELRQMEALAALGQMAGAVAHNLRNPMAGIRSSAELLRLEHPDARTTSEEIISEVDRLECCIRQLLEYTTVDTLALHQAEPLALVRETLAGHHLGLSRHRIALTVDDQRHTVGEVKVDALLFTQAMSSIVSNAIEAMPEGGALAVRLTDSSPRKIVLSFVDSGPGIAPEHLKLITEPFFTTKARGLGLGLPMARRIVERFGGKLEIGNANRRGTAVHIELNAA